ncbi:Exonuclease domain-containing protein [Psidium guajava]|nr:Exonuclease domain-containing protein [Psidium guajava]
MSPTADDARSEIAFFDVETTVPTRSGQRFAILEFGSILVCPRKLVELESYSTLVRPSDLSLISSLSVRCNGINPDAVVSAPTFAEIADKVHDILHGRIWAGHNILRFDCARIREAFAEIGRPAPEPKGTIDSLALLTQKFGRRAGDMKMATLATYFGLGQQTHRSLDDVRMNLEVVKYCATVLFLESSLPDIFTTNSWVSPNATTRSRSNGKLSNGGSSISSSTSGQKIEKDRILSLADQRGVEAHPIFSLLTTNSDEVVEPDTVQADAFKMDSLSVELRAEPLLSDVAMEEQPDNQNSDISVSSPVAASEGCSGYAGFLEPEEVSIPSIGAYLVPFYRGSQRIQLSHNGATLQLRCNHLRVRFGVDDKYRNNAGRPKFSFVVDTSPTLCRVLDACDDIAQKLSIDSGSSSEWRSVVSRKNGFVNSPTIRLQIPTVNADVPRYETEIYRKEPSGSSEKLVFSQCNAAEIKPLISTGTLVDACFSLDHYDYQQNAGIRLVAKKLFIHSN